MLPFLSIPTAAARISITTAAAARISITIAAAARKAKAKLGRL
jgi:hypothetical protein